MTTASRATNRGGARHIRDGDDLIVSLANGERVSVLDAIAANATRCRAVRIDQMAN